MTATLAPSGLAERFEALLPDATERSRFRTALEFLAPYRNLFRGERVLDYGASWGTSLVALLEHGAACVEGVDVDATRVAQGRAWLGRLGLGGRARLHHTPDTTRLGYPDRFFRFVLVNAVLEHIPQPRDQHIRECWRVLERGGVLLVSETPNKYFPLEKHTTGLWGNHWLPSRLARWRAVRAGRFDAARTDWASSGWRGLGFYELVAPLGRYELLPERSARRHRLFTALGLPASLLDPYPIWALRKG
jgi:SAM-dependent methyltransferase